MGGRGSSSGKAAVSTTESLISKANSEIKTSGASWAKLSLSLRRSIEQNMQLSKPMADAIRNGEKMADEWTTGFRGTKQKRKVITEVADGKIQYTLKDRNKIIMRTNDKGRVANKIAEFYIENGAR